MIVIEIIIFSVGLTIMIWGIAKYRSGIHLQDHGQKTTGKVIKVREENNDGFTYHYHTVYFETPEDVPIAKELNIGTTINSYPKGSKINIIYDPDNPRDFSIDSNTRLIIIPLALVGVGLFFIIYSFLLVSEVVTFPW